MVVFTCPSRRQIPVSIPPENSGLGRSFVCFGVKAGSPHWAALLPQLAPLEHGVVFRLPFQKMPRPIIQHESWRYLPQVMGFRTGMGSSLGFAITTSHRGLVFSFSLPRDPDYSPNGLGHSILTKAYQQNTWFYFAREGTPESKTLIKTLAPRKTSSLAIISKECYQGCTFFFQVKRAIYFAC